MTHGFGGAGVVAVDEGADEPDGTPEEPGLEGVPGRTFGLPLGRPTTEVRTVERASIVPVQSALERDVRFGEESGEKAPGSMVAVRGRLPGTRVRVAEPAREGDGGKTDDGDDGSHDGTPVPRGRFNPPISVVVEIGGTVSSRASW